ncbi:purine-nucleoside phosphorylase [Celerinatantimonas diazotrophica]|uniref:Purine nucleoside phosphorylase DeoD-type n=1 Tax=Celerinatantimonas diazotrophica TaxID=412034 RepID=A0A4R1K4Z6_9GAMM|nr:purine-nucleoside phosphorylase [Celerinatantimonas diazotrophica]TCK58099.1 purine-nucleoside phosphorylase [Celerinatantimonas diazotrophica]CAG9297829.1 Purine nucleoside phosphorylase DeoD-type [Celerinatantimonas diazotrophica]
MTPHINAKPGDFADTVIMPGDPLRAQYIAQTYLSDSIRVCDTRNMFGFTGWYQEQRVSVMSHGMGIPSISIYAHELINEFGVKNLIRVGTCGAVDDSVDIRNVIVATGAGTSSSVNRERFSGYDYAAVADFDLLRYCWQAAQNEKIGAHFGNTFTNDLLYDKPEAMLPALRKMHILAVEMETSALYTIAAQYRAKALSILTASVHSISAEPVSAEEYDKTMNQMIKLALVTATLIDS